MTDHVAAVKGMIAQLTQASRGHWKGPKIPIKDIERAINSTEGMKVASLQAEGQKAGGAGMSSNIISTTHLCNEVLARVGYGKLATLITQQVDKWQWQRARGKKLSESAQKCGSTVESVVSDFEQQLQNPEKAASYQVNTACARLDQMNPDDDPDAFQAVIQLGALGIDSFSQLLMKLCAQRDKAIRCCYDKLLDDGRDAHPKPSACGSTAPAASHTPSAPVPQASAVTSSAASAGVGTMGAAPSLSNAHLSSTSPSSAPLPADHAGTHAASSAGSSVSSTAGSVSAAHPHIVESPCHTGPEAEQPTQQRHTATACTDAVRRKPVPPRASNSQVAQAQPLMQNAAHEAVPLRPGYQQQPMPQPIPGDACASSSWPDASTPMCPPAGGGYGGGYGSGQAPLDVEQLIRRAVGPVLVKLVAAGVREIVNQVEHHLAHLLEQAGAGSADLHCDAAAHHQDPSPTAPSHEPAGDSHPHNHPELPQQQEPHAESQPRDVKPAAQPSQPVQPAQEHHAPPAAPPPASAPSAAQPVKPTPAPTPHVVVPAPAAAQAPEHPAPAPAPTSQPQPAPQPTVCVPAPAGSGDAPAGGASTSTNRGRARKAGAW